MYITVTDIYVCGHTSTSVSYHFKRPTVSNNLIKYKHADMGSTTTVEVTIEVLTNLQVPQETTTECSVESAATNSQSNDDAEVPVLEPKDDTTRQSKFTVWRVLEFVLLPTIIAAVWVLLALPTVFYLLSPLIVRNYMIVCTYRIWCG